MNKSLRGVFAPLLAAAVLASSLPALAKPPAAPAPTGTPAKAKRPNRMDKMAADLNLTDAQKARIKPIVDSANAQTKAIRDKTNAAIEAILTPAQKAKFEAAMHHGKKKPPK
jgi:Spy/CpxP family protein refolding chaperone